jgi:uncharacterized surface protein with fasciclin (FAS1) repeats
LFRARAIKISPGGVLPYFGGTMKDLSGRVRFVAARYILTAMLLVMTGPRVEAAQGKLLDIADTVAANPILTKLSALIQGSGMDTFLSSRGPFTLFAPTDAAFDRIEPGKFAALLRPENKVRLQDIVLFHVVNGKKWTAKDLLTVTSLLSCEGNPLAIRKTTAGTQMVLKAKIVHADIRCLNGIIHEIDTVLMPPESALPPLAPPLPVTVPAVSASGGTNGAPIAPVVPAGGGKDPGVVVIPVVPVATPEVSPH